MSFIMAVKGSASYIMDFGDYDLIVSYGVSEVGRGFCELELVSLSLTADAVAPSSMDSSHEELDESLPLLSCLQ